MKDIRTNKSLMTAAFSLALCFILSSCGNTASYEGFNAPEDKDTISPSGSVNLDYSYEGTEPLRETAKEVYKSDNGLCTIESRNSYYDVTLDYENGTYYEVGKAYGETIKNNIPFYSDIMEPYLYENIRAGLPEIKEDYSAVKERITALTLTLPDEYREEMNGFADGISGGISGFSEDGKISREEAMLLQLVPDILRQTACSAVSFSNSKSETGKRITARILEWDLGSDNQLCRVNSAVHMNNGEKSIMQVSYLGVLSTLTAVSNDGVTAGILDVGSGDLYEYEGKKSYTYYLRYQLENKSTASEVGKAMTDMSEDFTYSHNIILSDAENAFVAEDVTGGGALLRDSDVPLADGIEWNCKDSICAVNTFSSKKNNTSFYSSNLIRWVKYNSIINSEEKLSVSDIKYALTCENTDEDYTLGFIYSENVSLLLVTDYSDNSVQAVFTGPDGVRNHPDFIYLGSF